MLRQNTKMGVVALSMLMSIAFAQSSFAQYRYETPDGHQTVAPSQMVQQPMLNTQMANPQNISTKVSPPAVLDQPGVPSVNSVTAGSGVGNNKTQATQRGALVLPQGETSTMRVGPTEPVPMWQRALLAVWLLLMAGTTSIVALAVFRQKVVDDEMFNEGHIIHEDFREPLISDRTRRASGF